MGLMPLLKKKKRLKRCWSPQGLAAGLSRNHLEVGKSEIQSLKGAVVRIKGHNFPSFSSHLLTVTSIGQTNLKVREPRRPGWSCKTQSLEERSRWGFGGSDFSRSVISGHQPHITHSHVPRFFWVPGLSPYLWPPQVSTTFKQTRTACVA